MLRSLFRRERPGLPGDWQEILERRSAQWRRLDAGERERLGELADFVVGEKRWEAARGLELTDEIRTLVGAHAALLVLGLDETWLDEVGTIVLRRGTMRREAPAPRWGRVDGVVDGSPEVLDGEAHGGRGPLMINWTSARREANNLRLGRDVVLHEFAHKLDMHDSIIDGTPLIEDETARARWIDVCTAEFESLRRGDPFPLLRPYAATDPGEFFAVATETFFIRPGRMAAERPALYDVFRDFYRQDPAAREARANA